MPDVVSHLRAAGFTDDEIGAWSAEKRRKLTAAGFSDDEVDAYLGLPKTPKGVPQALLDRVVKVPPIDAPAPDPASLAAHGLAPRGEGASGRPVEGVVSRATEGAREGFGADPLGISPENLEAYWWARYLQPFAKMGDLILRTPGAVIGGLAGAGAGAAAVS